VSTVPLKSAFFTIVNWNRLGTGLKTVLSIDRDFVPAENVKVLSHVIACESPRIQCSSMS